jgi:hypothetical protein
MAQICVSGFKLTSQDLKAFEHYCLVSPKQWAQDALNGMINKSVKTILKDYLETFKAYTPDDVPSALNVLVPAIVAMPYFKPYNHKIEGLVEARRKGESDIEIWSGGFDVEDWNDIAMEAFYADYEQDLYNLMENKIACRKDAFQHEFEQQLMNNPSHPAIPKHVDDLIDLITSNPEYKNRAQQESRGAIP